jgi:hypothetical protein
MDELFLLSVVLAAGAVWLLQLLKVALTLVGKASSVAHENMILWRTGGAPQKLRHKNRVSVAHRTMRHRIKVFCGAYGPAAPQK